MKQKKSLRLNIKKHFFLPLFFLSFFQGDNFAQNSGLKNPSFENSTACPTGFSQFDLDLDGKPDVVKIGNSNQVGVYRNTSFTVGVTDVIAPVISGTRDTLYVDASGTVIGSVDTSNFSPVYSDNCGVDSVWMIVPSYTCISGSVEVALFAF